MKQNNKDAFFFPHDCNAQYDERILKLRVKYGWEGYGIYWAIVEKLRDSTGYKIETNVNSLAYSLNYDLDKLQNILTDCIEWKLLKSKEGFIYSESLLRRMQRVDHMRKSLSKAGKIGAKKRWHKEVKEIKTKEVCRPTIEMLTMYFREKNAPVSEASKFFDYYESNGWKVGRNSMKNWKSTVNNWIRRLPVSSVRPKEVIVMPKREEVNEAGLQEIHKLVKGITGK